MKQKTLVRSCQIAGIGVHNGVFTTIHLHPAEPDSGILFRNKSFMEDPLLVGTVIPEVAPHATVLRTSSWVVSTIEHLMAALWMLDIDNLVIEIDGPFVEIPILDGSAYPFIKIIGEQAGIIEQEAIKKFLVPVATIEICDTEQRYVKLKRPESVKNAFSLHYAATFEHPLLGELPFTGEITQQTFIEEIAPARTFGFLEQLPMLRQHKLALGSSLGNSVVVRNDGFLNERRFKDEFVRHKVLDLIGDLSLIGKKFIGTIEAAKTGHSFNRRIIEHYMQHPEAWELVTM